MKPFFHAIFHAIFWLWNLTFLLVVYAGILPVIAPALIAATFAGQIPIEFFLTLVCVIAVPTVCTLVGALRFIKQPVQLIRMFYGVEAPLFLLCLIRLFLLRELTPASAQILGTVVVCIAAFSLELLYGYMGGHRGTAPTIVAARLWGGGHVHWAPGTTPTGLVDRHPPDGHSPMAWGWLPAAAAA